jgi:hypothetical protein
MTLPLGIRFLLGVFEAGLFPGVNYYLSWCVPVVFLGLKLSPHLVGTNVQNSVFVRHFSFRRPRYQVHSVVCSPYVNLCLLGNFY